MSPLSPSSFQRHNLCVPPGCLLIPVMPLAIHNREAPIGQLPVELLADIFHIGLQEYGLDDHRAIKYLGAITSTCSAWRYAALGTPSLWRRIIYKERCRPEIQRPRDPSAYKGSFAGILIALEGLQHSLAPRFLRQHSQSPGNQEDCVSAPSTLPCNIAQF